MHNYILALEGYFLSAVVLCGWISPGFTVYSLEQPQEANATGNPNDFLDFYFTSSLTCWEGSCSSAQVADVVHPMSQQNVSKCSMDLTPGFKNELQSKEQNLSKEKVRHELEGSCDRVSFRAEGTTEGRH